MGPTTDCLSLYQPFTLPPSRSQYKQNLWTTDTTLNLSSSFYHLVPSSTSRKFRLDLPFGKIFFFLAPWEHAKPPPVIRWILGGWLVESSEIQYKSMYEISRLLQYYIIILLCNNVLTYSDVKQAYVVLALIISDKTINIKYLVICLITAQVFTYLVVCLSTHKSLGIWREERNKL